MGGREHSRLLFLKFFTAADTNETEGNQFREALCPLCPLWLGSLVLWLNVTPHFFRASLSTHRLKTNDLLGSFGNWSSFFIAGQSFRLLEYLRSRIQYSSVDIHLVGQ